MKAPCCQVNTVRGADFPKGGQALPPRYQEADGGQTGHDGQDADGGRRETVGGPPLHLVPEGVEPREGAHVGREEVCPIQDDGRDE